MAGVFEDEFNTNPTSRKRLPIERKIAAVEEYLTKKYEVKETCRRFGIPSESSLYAWAKDINKLRNEASKGLNSKKKCKPDSYSRYPEIEHHVKQWFISQRRMDIKY